jgi:ribonucleoside-triphosphate reductase
MKKSSNEKMGKGIMFERIRRITGYLVGTMDKWNNAKKAEERDRVKHSIGGAKWDNTK